eukprot:12350_1
MPWQLTTVQRREIPPYLMPLPSIAHSLDEAERAGLQRISRLSEDKEWEKIKACESGLRGEYREPKLSTADHDSLGHYVLLLACCDSEKRSLWLSRRESLLCETFIRQQFPFPSREAAQLAIIDYGAQDWLRPCSAGDRDYFSCDWRRVLKLVEGRHVVVHSGIAWLHADHVPYALAEDHCSRLRHCLGWLRRIKPSLTVSGMLDNINPLLVKLGEECDRMSGRRKNTVQSSFKVPAISIEDLIKPKDQSVELRFPLCMRHMLWRLRVDNHLKFQARTQLCLFLKHCGLDLNGAQALWRRYGLGMPKYMKCLPPLYGSIEHGGKDYRPYRCSGIQHQGGPTTKEHAHGCPFLHWSTQDLKKGLSNTGIIEADIEDILYVTKLQPGGRSSGCRTSKDACNGCRRHFQALHGDPAPPHETPNDWFVHSTQHFIPARGGMC